jgi:hypothetical protein
VKAKRHARRYGRNGASTLPPLESLYADPPPVRIRQKDGATAVLRDEWRDPTDTAPNAARSARTVTGYRSFDPLRKMARNGAGTSITAEHIAAADMLRKAAEVGGMGYAPAFTEAMPVQAITYGPRGSPPRRCLAQTRAIRSFARAMELFPVPWQRRMIVAILLQNHTIARWTQGEIERGQRCNTHHEMGKLLCLLDLLAEHFKTDIEEAERRGHLLPV